MNDSALRQGNNPYLAMLVSSLLSLVIGFCIAKYNTDYSAQINSQNAVVNAESAEIRSDAMELAQVKVNAKNDEAEISRVESIAMTAQANANAVVNQLGALKTALDAQTEGFHALQKQVSDMDRWLRPDPSIPRSR